jgi:hypothetical protein
MKDFKFHMNNKNHRMLSVIIYPNKIQINYKLSHLIKKKKKLKPNA